MNKAMKTSNSRDHKVYTDQPTKIAAATFKKVIQGTCNSTLSGVDSSATVGTAGGGRSFAIFV
jgi:hypothetical protein